MAGKRWVPETLFDELCCRMTYEVDRVLHETRTEHQHLVLFEHRFFGKILMLDGATQVTSRDEFVYHEMMTHVPLFAHGRAKEVLIVGGGDCGIAEEVLRHKSIERVTQVEIDASVVEFAKQHFPEFTGPVLADKRFELVIDDGMNYVAATKQRFDQILDPRGARRRLRVAPLHCRQSGESNKATRTRSVGGYAELVSGKGQEAADSFATSKLSSISTLFGSRTKICQRRLFGT